ncbi:helix-turn-helix domain-containing protein [Paracoccaceae bacterium GXU_MW_L88]
MQKLYAGTKLRSLRTGRGLTQKDFAASLGVSLSYLNQMENNNRPVSTAVVLALASEYGLDVTELSAGDNARLIADMKEALADPLFGDHGIQQADLSLIASNAPAMGRALLDLYHAHLRANDRLASLDARMDQSVHSPAPWEEVRDFFHYCDNYLDAIDRSAETMTRQIVGDGPLTEAAIIAHLGAIGIEVKHAQDAPLRHYALGEVLLSARAGPATRIFQLCHQLALIARDDLLDATLDLARFRNAESREICKIGLANYFAGAMLMPYTRFHRAARETRHDLERLAEMFGASIEQVAHRLSTLQRPGLKGVPFFFVRVDQAGTITKRHSATALQFARFGGGCPLWNVHRAFETPGRFLRQLAETPDGRRYFCLARDVFKPGGHFRAPTRRFAIGLGCEITHADQIVYADDLAPNRDSAFEPIGISCRICPRQSCHQRAVPPMDRPLRVDPDSRDLLPYRFD